MRLWFISSEFPNPCQPSKAVFNLNLVQALSRSHACSVIAPVPWTDELSRRRVIAGLGVPAECTELCGIDVHYPRYNYPPKLLRSRYGDFFLKSIRSHAFELLSTRGAPDAVVSYWAHPDGYAASCLARMLGVPSALIIGGSDVMILPNRASRRRCVVEACRATDLILTVSQSLKQRVEQLGIPTEKVQVWHQGVDSSVFWPGSRLEARRRLGIAQDGASLVWVGRMVPVKSLDVLLAACAQARQDGEAFRLYLVGDGPLRPALELDCARRKLADVVHFMGSRSQDQLGDWYRSANLTVLSSASEGLPNVLRESLACGTPFVATQVGGISEIADDPATQLVTPGDPVALAGAIRHMLHASVGDKVSSKSLSWGSSAQSLVDRLAPLVEDSRDPDRPWWARRAGSCSPARRQRVTFRRTIRQILAPCLPARLLLTHGPAGSGSVCLTFDDGPHPSHTPRLLDVLAQLHVRATFFLLGNLAEKYPHLVRRIAAEGHLVANHSFHHLDGRLVTSGELVAGARKAGEALAKLTGHPARMYRPPEGRVGMRELGGLWRAGYTVVLWNVDSRDYASSSTEQVRAHLNDRPLRGGDLVLMHDRLPYAAEVVPELVASARTAGLRFCTVDQWASGERRALEPAVPGRAQPDTVLAISALTGAADAEDSVVSPVP